MNRILWICLGTSWFSKSVPAESPGFSCWPLAGTETAHTELLVNMLLSPGGFRRTSSLSSHFKLEQSNRVSSKIWEVLTSAGFGPVFKIFQLR